jgi:hypothetical protein
MKPDFPPDSYQERTSESDSRQVGAKQSPKETKESVAKNPNIRHFSKDAHPDTSEECPPW